MVDHFKRGLAGSSGQGMRSNMSWSGPGIELGLIVEGIVPVFCAPWQGHVR